MKLQYTVASVGEADIVREVTVDGQVAEVRVPGLSVQLVSSGHGSIALNLTAGQAKDHPFKAGKKIIVTFGGSE